MTPQEKAKELVDKFTNLYEGINLGLAKKHWAKQSALIAIDLKLEGPFPFNDIEYGEDSSGYWDEVKKEIEKL